MPRRTTALLGALGPPVLGSYGMTFYGPTRSFYPLLPGVCFTLSYKKKYTGKIATNLLHLWNLFAILVSLQYKSFRKSHRLVYTYAPGANFNRPCLPAAILLPNETTLNLHTLYTIKYNFRSQYTSSVRQSLPAETAINLPVVGDLCSRAQNLPITTKHQSL